jgi:branched-subunit amino acid aminotransferase/4-amino-4-deoxychorismate lyase
MLQNLDGARESEIEIEDLVRADRIFICNALRGPRSVHSIEDEDQLPIWKFQQPH